MTKNTEQAILKAARKVFIQRGFAGARMQEIANEAGINKAMLHYYYRSKEKLFLVIFEEILGKLIPQLGAALEMEGTVPEKIEKVVRVYITTLMKYPHMPLFVMHELSQNRAQFLEILKGKIRIYANIQDFFQQIIEEQAEGKIKSVPPLHLLINIISMCIFPFVARPVFCNVLEIPEEQFQEILEQRVAVVTQFVKDALRV